MDDPQSAGLQADTRQRPQRHPDAVARLRAFAQQMRLQESHYERRKVPREDLPQRLPPPKPEPERKFKLKPFPCRTFGDLEAWGLKARIDCLNCHRTVPLEVGGNLKTKPMLTTRLRCTGLAGAFTRHACNSRGVLYLRPADQSGVVPNKKFISAWCHGPNHTGIDASYLVVSRPPWQGILAKDELFGCPVCRCRMRHCWHDNTDGSHNRVSTHGSALPQF